MTVKKLKGAYGDKGKKSAKKRVSFFRVLDVEKATLDIMSKVKSIENIRLRNSEKSVLAFLWEQQLGNGDEKQTPPVSLATIAVNCRVTTRTVQRSCDRLVDESLIERVGSDWGNKDLSQRSMVYRVLLDADSVASLTSPFGR